MICKQDKKWQFTFQSESVASDRIRQLWPFQVKITLLFKCCSTFLLSWYLFDIDLLIAVTSPVNAKPNIISVVQSFFSALQPFAITGSGSPGSVLATVQNPVGYLWDPGRLMAFWGALFERPLQIVQTVTVTTVLTFVWKQHLRRVLSYLDHLQH